jgi:hypothetical protein
MSRAAAVRSIALSSASRSPARRFLGSHPATSGSAFAFSLVIGLGAACSTPPSDARFVVTPPDAASFPPVAAMLVQACGTLDCHGTVGRNLKIYGNTGLRLSAADVPTALTPTTNEEVAQDYDSVVGLEPETMSAVVALGGANPERLTFVRKARGTESHKGGAVVVAGDARDRCITTWLAGDTDASSCTVALLLP